MIPVFHERIPSISAISSMFYEIRDQSHAAEQYGLLLVAGPGYRKALEHLVKDYVASRHTDESTKKSVFKNPKLVEVIRMVGDKRIEDVATRAAWLGNDETHYDRKWESHDISHLKKLITLTERFIASQLEADEMIASMPKT